MHGLRNRLCKARTCVFEAETWASSAVQVKDPNAPKKPCGAYMWFCKDKREEVKAENPGEEVSVSQGHPVRGPVCMLSCRHQGACWLALLTAWIHSVT